MGFYGGCQLSAYEDQEFLAGDLFCLFDQHSFFPAGFPSASVYQSVGDRQTDQDLDVLHGAVPELCVFPALHGSFELVLLDPVLRPVLHSFLHGSSGRTEDVAGIPEAEGRET